ncbi:hypothetical protein K435DRAFT_797447 [Dendrothele bispora CBS 962.96]|uniref:Uncharacterized protein n=1 Tax=Dendrothele bispora (strain CBS 962.96) TaxID=1314807 RepID=A0A4S8M2V5_DENBC|nr:hypothetical protein K435DRAFT_797447 [Dendrothele bispora CBS 962.96]
MLLAALSSLVLRTEDMMIQIPSMGYNPLPDLGKNLTGLEIGLNLMNRVTYVIGDIVVVWRAWVLFPQRLPAKIALSICLMGSFVGVFWDTGLLIKRVMKSPYDIPGGEKNVILLAVPLIFTNFTATTLIGFKAWHHFQNIQNNLGSTNGSPIKVLKILLLLIESGLLYLAFWVIASIGYIVVGLKGTTGMAAEIYLTIMLELVAIYPVLIILAVAYESNKPENLNDMSLSQSIRFASVQASKLEVHQSESGGKSQPASSAARIDNVERNEIEVVPRLS